MPDSLTLYTNILSSEGKGTKSFLAMPGHGKQFVESNDSVAKPEKEFLFLTDTKTDLLPDTSPVPFLFFDIPEGYISPADTISFTEKPASSAEGVLFPFNLQSQSWISLLFICQFFIYFYVFVRFKKFWVESIKELFQTKERSSLFVDTSGKDSRQNFYLSFLCAINLAIFLYLFISKDHVHYENQSVKILLFIAAVLVFFVIKLGLLEFLRYVFLGKSSSVDSVRNSLFVLTSLFGLSLYINDLFLIYSRLSQSNILFFTGLGLYLIYVLLTAYRLIKHFYKRFYSFLYLILYLCTLEVLPAALLYAALFGIEHFR